MKNELILTGYSDLTPTEEEEVQALFPPSSIQLHLTQSKSTELDLMQIVFHDFSVTAFVRDAILSQLLAESYTLLKPAIQYLRRKRPADSICIERFLEEDGKRFSIYIVAKPEQFEQLLQELEYIPRQRLVSESDKGFVMIRYDERGHLEIIDMSA
jgi:hypothetical protein